MDSKQMEIEQIGATENELIDELYMDVIEYIATFLDFVNYYKFCFLCKKLCQLYGKRPKLGKQLFKHILLEMTQMSNFAMKSIEKNARLFNKLIITHLNTLNMETRFNWNNNNNYNHSSSMMVFHRAAINNSNESTQDEVIKIAIKLLCEDIKRSTLEIILSELKYFVDYNNNTMVNNTFEITIKKFENLVRKGLTNMQDHTIILSLIETLLNLVFYNKGRGPHGKHLQMIGDRCFEFIVRIILRKNSQNGLPLFGWILEKLIENSPNTYTNNNNKKKKKKQNNWIANKRLSSKTKANLLKLWKTPWDTIFIHEGWQAVAQDLLYYGMKLESIKENKEYNDSNTDDIARIFSLLVNSIFNMVEHLQKRTNGNQFIIIANGKIVNRVIMSCAAKMVMEKFFQQAAIPIYVCPSRESVNNIVDHPDQVFSI